VNFFRLPVSAIGIVLRQPTGAEDILIMEGYADDAALAIALIKRLAQAAAGCSLCWEDLPVSDLDAILLRIRQTVFGDLILADAACPVPACGKRIDLAFGVNEYLEHHAPRRTRSAEPAPEAGWMRLRGVPVSFRFPTGADQLAVALDSDPRAGLIRRCIMPTDIPSAALRRVERAMEALAPSLAHNLNGHCPECGASFEVYFDPRQFTLRELRDQAVFIYEDTHLLAEHYHWPEAEILALPRERRLRYAQMVRASRSAA
jgi:hypothetical protein